MIRFLKLAAGYLFYVLPIGGVGYLFLLVKSESFVCQEMKAPFLLDNAYPPAVNMTHVYEMRINSNVKECMELSEVYDDIEKCERERSG